MKLLISAVIQYRYGPYKKRKLGHKFIQKEDNVKTLGGEDNHDHLRRGASGEINPANTLISDF